MRYNAHLSDCFRVTIEVYSYEWANGRACEKKRLVQYISVTISIDHLLLSWRATYDLDIFHNSRYVLFSYLVSNPKKSQKVSCNIISSSKSNDISLSLNYDFIQHQKVIRPKSFPQRLLLTIPRF
jgi:hypothetical protein